MLAGSEPAPVCVANTVTFPADTESRTPLTGHVVRFAHAKALLARVLCHPFVGTILGQVYRNRIPSRGCLIDTGGTMSPIVNAYLFWGLYESAEIRFVQQYLRRDLDVLELGSSLGVVACHIARRLDQGRRLVCVEANGELLSLIKTNLDRNVSGTTPTILHGAIDYSVPVGTAVPLALGDTNLTSVTAHNSEMLETTATAPAITLGAVLRQHSIDDYALVADIEGAEAGMLLREEEALTRCRQMIIELHRTEFNGQVFSAAELADVIMRRHGFAMQAVHGPVYVFEK